MVYYSYDQSLSRNQTRFNVNVHGFSVVHTKNKTGYYLDCSEVQKAFSE